MYSYSVISQSSTRPRLLITVAEYLGDSLPIQQGLVSYDIH